MNIKQSLLSSLKLVVFYVCMSAFMCTAFAAVYMVYTLCINMVAGQQLAFDIKLFLEGVLIFLPFVLILQAMFMTLWMIRHPESTILPIAVYAALYLSSWIFVLPATVRETPFGAGRYIGQNVSDKPSAGYFRSSSDKIFYYSTVDEASSLANGLCVDINTPSDNVYTFSNVRLSQKRTVFTDSLIQNTIEMPSTLSILMDNLKKFFTVLGQCSKGGGAYWLCFASMALPLLAVVALRRFSQWRLVSVISIIFVTFGVLTFNVVCYTGYAVTDMDGPINELLTKIPPLWSLCRVGNPCVILANIVFFFVLVGAFFAFEFKNRKFVEGSEESFGDSLGY